MCTALKDKSDVILDFSYCQQIAWKDQNQQSGSLSLSTSTACLWLSSELIVLPEDGNLSKQLQNSYININSCIS